MSHCGQPKLITARLTLRHCTAVRGSVNTVFKRINIPQQSAQRPHPHTHICCHTDPQYTWHRDIRLRFVSVMCAPLSVNHHSVQLTRPCVRLDWQQHHVSIIIYFNRYIWLSHSVIWTANNCILFQCTSTAWWSSYKSNRTAPTRWVQSASNGKFNWSQLKWENLHLLFLLCRSHWQVQARGKLLPLLHCILPSLPCYTHTHTHIHTGRHLDTQWETGSPFHSPLTEPPLLLSLMLMFHLTDSSSLDLPRAFQQSWGIWWESDTQPHTKALSVCECKCLCVCVRRIDNQFHCVEWGEGQQKGHGANGRTHVLSLRLLVATAHVDAVRDTKQPPPPTGTDVGVGTDRGLICRRDDAEVYRSVFTSFSGRKICFFLNLGLTTI